MAKAKNNANGRAEMPFSRENYMWLPAAVGLVALGFFLMAGGGPDSPNEFNPEIFSFRRITLAPAVVLAGYALTIFAIMKKPGTKE